MNLCLGIFCGYIQVFIGNSAKYSDIGHPCGYLKASSNLQTVNLFVMPYNFPVLIPLLGTCYKLIEYVMVCNFYSLNFTS